MLERSSESIALSILSGDEAFQELVHRKTFFHAGRMTKIINQRDVTVTWQEQWKKLAMRPQ